MNLLSALTSLMGNAKSAGANVASRAYDQINPLDNGLTATNRTPIMANLSKLQQPFKDTYAGNNGMNSMSPIDVNQFVTPHAIPTKQASDLLRQYYEDDLSRQPSAQELQHGMQQYGQGHSLADVQIDDIASTNEALGFQQNPEQQQQTRKFLYNSKDKANTLSHQLYGKKPTFGQFHTVGELVENGMTKDQINKGLAPSRPESSMQQLKRLLHG